jgi:hypothetical protein
LQHFRANARFFSLIHAISRARTRSGLRRRKHFSPDAPEQQQPLNEFGNMLSVRIGNLKKNEQGV